MVTKLTPWKDVITPHPDVASGRYVQAEFAADLAQMLEGRADSEYQDPVEFYNRTYITAGIRGLLRSAMERLTGSGGEPVIQLKTSFGSGKTHSMLALYHLLSGNKQLLKLDPVKDILSEAGLDSIPKATCAVLVGTYLDPTKGQQKEELGGGEIRTLWGEMAFQLAVEWEYDASLRRHFHMIVPARVFFSPRDLWWDGRDGYRLVDGKVAFRDPSVTEGGPAALIVDADDLIERLDKLGLRLVWTLLGEKWILGGPHDELRPRRTFSQIARLEGDGSVEIGERVFFDNYDQDTGPLPIKGKRRRRVR